MGYGSMLNGRPPNSSLERKLPIASWLCWRGKRLSEGEFAEPSPWFSVSAPGLKSPPILRHRQPFWARWWCTAPSLNVAFQSCPFWWQATHSIAITTSDFSIPPSSPSASQQWVLLAMDGPGNCPLCQQHTRFPPAIRHLLCPQGWWLPNVSRKFVFLYEINGVCLPWFMLV